jgi:hypothetical protein
LVLLIKVFYYVNKKKKKKFLKLILIEIFFFFWNFQILGNHLEPMGVGSCRTSDACNGFSPIGKQKKMGTRRKREGGEYTTGGNRGEGDGRKKMRGE